MHAIAEAQKRGGYAAFIDAEHALDPVYAKNLGIDINNLILSQPDTGEQALDIAEHLIRSNAIDIIVIDSVAALVPKVEIDGDMGDAHIGMQARLMSQAMRKLSGAISKSKTIAIFINQIREKVGVLFGSPETTSGGRALKFYSTIRLDIRRVDTIKGEILSGTDACEVVKSKVAPPFKAAKWSDYGKGISYEEKLIWVSRTILSRRAAWFRITMKNWDKDEKTSRNICGTIPTWRKSEEKYGLLSWKNRFSRFYTNQQIR